MANINIVIAEDHQMFREAIISELAHFSINTLAQAGNGTELLEVLTQHKPDIILLDIEMPGMDGEDALEIITVEYPEIKVIVVSFHEDAQYMIHLLEAGAHAFIPKNFGMETLVAAIQKVKSFGYCYDNIPEHIMKQKLEKTNEETKKKLTKRQTEIIPMICDGKTNKEIADSLKIVTKTVEAHRKIIYDKTNCSSNIELYRYAQKNRIIKT